MVGAALKSKRKNLVLSTKSPRARQRRGAEGPRHQPQRLGTDYVDIWYLHAKSKARQITDELLEAQQIAKKAGKIRFAGVSTHGGQHGGDPGLHQERPRST